MCPQHEPERRDGILTERRACHAFTRHCESFGLHAGGGLQFFFNRHFSIDSTYRYIWLEKIESKDQNIVGKKFNDNGYVITIGVTFHF